MLGKVFVKQMKQIRPMCFALFTAILTIQLRNIVSVLIMYHSAI